MRVGRDPDLGGQLREAWLITARRAADLRGSLVAA
jgi:hypothetical protein